MTDAASPSDLRIAPAPRRLVLALAASAAMHLCIAAWLLAPAPRPAPASGYTISARLAPEEQVAPVRSQLPDLRPAARLRETQERPPTAVSTTDEVPARLTASEAPYYPAADLDVFPMPLEPLRLQRLQDALGNAAGIRALVKIDEHGNVRDVEIAGAGRQSQEELRALLVAARFTPARKDGRAVNSRIVLDIRVADY